jgi:hypothetical protein
VTKTVNDYLKRLGSLDSERSSFIPHWKELSENIEPRRGRFFVSDRNKGDRRHKKIINSRATQALRTAQSGIFTGIMSPTRPWFRFETLDPDAMRSQEVKLWLHSVEELMRAIFLESNLYNMAPVMLGEVLLFGTGAMSQVDDFENVARFYTHTVGSYYIAQNERFVVDTFALKRELQVKQIVQEFGLANVSDFVKKAWDDGNYYTWAPVVQMIEPNIDADNRKPSSEFKPFISVWFEPNDINSADRRFLRKKGFDELPVHVARWALAGEDIYGTNCPGMVALGDTKGMQISEKRKAQAVDKLVNPPLKGPPTLRDVPINSLPGGVNIYDTDGTKEGLTTVYQVDPRLNEMRADIQAIEGRINEAFFVDLFLAISAMQGIQPRNELELSQRNEERLLMLGPPLERLQLEFLSRTIDRTFNQALRAGILPPPPEGLQGQSLGIRYISSLAQAQRAIEIATIERTAFFASQLAAIKPEVLDTFNADESLRQFAQMTGAVPQIIVPTEDVEETREKRAQQQEAMLQSQLQQEGAKAAADGGSAVKDVADATNAES